MVTAYLRVSTDKQSVENQRSEIQRFSKNRNLDVQKWVTEVVSGKVKSSNRKIGSLVKRLKKDDVLIVSELSRLSRTLLEIMSLLNILISKGVIVYSTKENCCLGDNINSKVMMFAFGLAAEIERDLISLRTKEALAAKRLQGVRLGKQLGDHPKIDCLLQRRDEVMEDYESGMSVPQICRKYKVSRSTFRKFRLHFLYLDSERIEQDKECLVCG